MLLFNKFSYAIDKTKFSKKNIEYIINNNKVLEEAKNKLQIDNECKILKNTLMILINNRYYSYIKKNQAPTVLDSDYLEITKMHNFNHIKSECGIDFNAISIELSEAMQDNIKVNLYNKVEYGCENKNLKYIQILNENKWNAKK